MRTQRKWLLTAGILIILCIAGCIGLARVAQSGSAGQAPIKGMRIEIPESGREEFFMQMRRFAEEHDFDFHLDVYDPNQKVFLVTLYRSDLKVLAADVPRNASAIRLDFYESNPSNPVSEETVAKLFDDIKRLMLEIPDASIVADG